MKLKTVEIDGKTYAEVTDGKPLYVAEDGKETPLDAWSLSNRVTQLNAEAMGHRKAKEEVETKLKAFEGIDDAEAARKALETVANLDAGQLVTAGKVEEIRAGAKKAAEEAAQGAIKARDEQIKALTGEKDNLNASLVKEIIGGAFARSKFVAEKVAVPPPMLEKTYGANFKIEDGKVVAYDASGAQIHSRVTGGPATFDEALEIIISADPYKDHILKGSVGAGGGAGGGDGGRSGKTLPRSEFAKLAPADQMAKMKDGYTLTEA